MPRARWLPRAVAAAAAIAALLALPAAPALAQNVVGPDADCAPPADDDPATLEARVTEHFRRGDDLYDDGEYELAITEYKASYCLLPNESAAYNIGLCYMGLVDYEHALAWFELYLRIAAPDSKRRKSTANRVDRLRKLPARVNVATDPPGATVTMTGETGDPVVGKANAQEPLEVQSGKWVMRIELPGYEPAEQTVELRIGQPYTYSFRLSQRHGVVRITTEPLSARIFVDDKLVAVGSFLDELPLGEHTVTVEAEGRKPHTESIIVAAKGETKLHVVLPAPPQSGRWELVTAATAMGGIAGGALGNVVFSQGGLGSTAFVSGGLAIGFAGAYFGASKTVPVGHTSYIIGGALWGAGEGLGLGLLLSPDDDDALAALAVTGVGVGVLTTALTASRFDLSAGDAALINSGAMWGSITSVLVLTLFDADDQVGGGFLLAGLNLGLLAGGALAARTDYSRGHVALIDVSGFGGMILGLALAPAFIDDSGDASSSDTEAHFVLGGAGLGLVAGSLLTRKMDQDKPQRGFRALSPSTMVAKDASGEAVLLWGVSALLE